MDVSAIDVQQTMRILELLSPAPDGLRVSHIANEIEVNKAIAHRLLAALIAAGYVYQDPATETYIASFRLGALGLRQVESAGIDQWAQGPLDRLARRTTELVRLAVASGHRLQWIAKAQGSNSRVILDPVTGSDVVPHATASGKAWLSTLPPNELAAVLGPGRLSQQTPRTTTSVAALRKILEEARRQGYATTFEEMDPGINAIAAPVFGDGPEAPATGTVSVAGPASRLTADRLVGYAADVLHTAEELGCSWPAYAYLRKGARETV